MVIIDMVNDGVPMDGYYIDELPAPKNGKLKTSDKQKSKQLKEERLELPLQEHEWVRNGK